MGEMCSCSSGASLSSAAFSSVSYQRSYPFRAVDGESEERIRAVDRGESSSEGALPSVWGGEIHSCSSVSSSSPGSFSSVSSSSASDTSSASTYCSLANLRVSSMLLGALVASVTLTTPAF